MIIMTVIRKKYNDGICNDDNKENSDNDNNNKIILMMIITNTWILKTIMIITNA